MYRIPVNIVISGPSGKTGHGYDKRFLINYWQTLNLLRVVGGSFPFWQYFAIQLIKCNHDSFFTTTKQERQWCSADPNESSLMCCDGLSPLCLCGGSPSRIEMRRVIDHSQSRFFVNEHRGGDAMVVHGLMAKIFRGTASHSYWRFLLSAIEIT